MIPKQFHFIWLNRGRVPSQLEFGSILSHQFIYGPEFKYILWTDDLNLQFDGLDELKSNGLQIRYLFDEVDELEKHSDEWKAWGCWNGIPFECDYYRYQLLYKFGGIWCDLDSYALRNGYEELKLYDYVSCLEIHPFTQNIVGSFIGFFMSRPKSKFIEKYLDLRHKISAEVVCNNQLGILCGDVDGSLFLDHDAFLPVNWHPGHLGKFLNGDTEIWNYHSYRHLEFHMYNDAVDRIKNGRQIAMLKVENYINFLRHIYE